jgi:hypothetical protein
VGLVALVLRLVMIFGVMKVPSIDWDEMELMFCQTNTLHNECGGINLDLWADPSRS